jgi:glycosyltransferase involved in cell wall biosynthesis
MHVITSLETGGAEMMLLKLLSATQGRYPQTVVSMKDEGTIGPRIKELGIPLYTLGLRANSFNPFRAFSIRSLVHQFRPQVILGWMYHGNAMACLASTFTRPRVPVVWDVQASLRGVYDFGILTGMVIQLGAFLSRYPARIIYVSQVAARQHEGIGYRQEKRIVIPNGIDCDMFRPDNEARRLVRAELGLAPETILVGLVARYHPAKDHAGFLTAAAQVASTHKSVCFLAIGTGVTPDHPALAELVRRFQLENRVFLLGERRDTPRLTAALDIACSTSAYGEAFSVAVGEAMACGVPCVVTDVGDSAFMVGDTGLSTAPSNSAALADAITSLIDAGVNRRRELGEAARKRVENEFSLGTIASRYEGLYRQLACPACAGE